MSPLPSAKKFAPSAQASPPNLNKAQSGLQIPLSSAIIVRPGDRIPVDRKVIDGFSAVDDSALTGEELATKHRRYK